MEKLFAICAIAIIPFNNDIRLGGTAEKLCLTQCGGLVAATKDSYPRLYKADGTYTYPRDPEKQLKKKGELYFENHEITGSKKTEKGKAKFPLTKWIVEELYGKLCDLCTRLKVEIGK